MAENLLNLQEAAKKLGIKPITLRKWDREGKLKAVRVGARGDRKYREQDLLEFLEKSKQKKIEWLEYIRSGTSYHQSIHPLEALRSGIKKYFDINAKYLMNYFENSTLFWYYDKNNLYEIGKKVIEKFLSSKDFENNFFKSWDEKSAELLAFIKNTPKEKVEKMKTSELALHYKKFAQIIYEFYSIVMAIDGTDESLAIDINEKIKNILKNKLKEKYTEREFIRIYNISTMPSQLSYLNDERKMVLETIKDLKSGRIINSSQEFKARIQKLVELFWWTNLGWPREKGKDFSYFDSEIKSNKKSEKEVQNELDEIQKYKEKAKKEKNAVEKEYNLSKDKELAEYLRILDRLFIYHDFRKEVQMKYNYYEFQILDEISKRSKVHASLLDWCLPEEIISILQKGELNENEINQRKEHFLYFNNNGKISTWSGIHASKEHEKILGDHIGDVKDLQGISASPGKVVGEAFVAITLANTHKIKPGQILITGMTTPDFLPAMKKASALVTDEGGITCHAAIVSRELGVPCIVGTKSATRTIKTGDLVEVDANHGVIRILEK
ncbi:MAG: PEP-utilizing enzyme [archaeon]